MKIFILAATTALGTAVAVPASAQDITGEVFLTYTSVGNGISSATDAGASVAGSFGRFGVQLDYSSYESDTSYSIANWVLHASYMIGDTTQAGLFYAHEDWEGSTYSSTGVEVAHSRGPLTVEAFYAQYQNISASAYDTKMFGVNALYDINSNIAVGGGVTKFTGDDEGSRIELRGRYEFGNGLGTALVVGHENYTGSYEATTVGVTVDYQFGGGTTFGRRDFIGILPGY